MRPNDLQIRTIIRLLYLNTSPISRRLRRIEVRSQLLVLFISVFHFGIDLLGLQVPIDMQHIFLDLEATIFAVSYVRCSYSEHKRCGGGERVGAGDERR